MFETQDKTIVPLATERDHHRNDHILADIEVADRFFGSTDGGFLARHRCERFQNELLHVFRRVLFLAQTRIDNDLGDAGQRMHVARKKVPA